MDLLTGPRSYIPGETFIDVNGNNIYENGIDTPLDTAVNYLGPIGITIFPGAKNLDLTSSVFYIGGDPNLNDPGNVNEARNYTLGKTRVGNTPDPCTFAYGEVRGGVDCSEVNPSFWFSGDPVTDVGWICTQNRDVRGMGSAGPFKLPKDEEVEILVGYEIDRSTTPLGGITAVRVVSDAVQDFYENNFGYPIVSVEDEQPVVSEFKLEQNYPNPFNPSTKIKFTIPSVTLRQAQSDNWVVLKVYDVLGNEVATIVNKELPAGEYEVEFSAKGRSASGGNASNLSSGIYFYTLKAGSFTQSKKMILVK
jgi:hypothetical protein